MRQERYLSNKVIGQPKETDKYTPEQLEAIGMVGIYSREEEEER